MQAGEEEEERVQAMGGQGSGEKGGREGGAGRSDFSTEDAASTGLRTHRHVSISFKVRRKKIPLYLEENVTIHNTKVFLVTLIQS